MAKDRTTAFEHAERLTHDLRHEVRKEMGELRLQLTQLSVTIGTLSHVVLHDMIIWRCETCGEENRLLRMLVKAVTLLTCASCGCVAKDDYRTFHVTRS